MIVLVTGGTMFRDQQWLWDGLDLLHSLAPITRIIEGGAIGADCYAKEWADRKGIPVHTEEADWEQYGKAAGPIRNTAMAKMQPDVVLVAPGRKGTKNMVEVAYAHRLRVVMLEKMPVKRTMENPLLGAPMTVVVDA